MLTYAGAATTKTLLEDPEKLASSIVVVTQAEGVTYEALRLVLTHGNSAVTTQLLEKPTALVKAIQKAIETVSKARGFHERDMMRILTYSNSAVITQFIQKPAALVKAIQKAVKISGFDAGWLVQLLAHAGAATTKTLLENPKNLAGSIVVLTQVEHVTSEAALATHLWQHRYHHPVVGGACILGQGHPEGCQDIRFRRGMVSTPVNIYNCCHDQDIPGGPREIREQYNSHDTGRGYRPRRCSTVTHPW